MTGVITRPTVLVMATALDRKPLTPAQAAEYLQCTPNKIYQLLQQGKMPGRKVGGTWLIPYRRLIAWLEEQP